MNDTSQDAWFYTREGEKIGPVSLSDLRIKAADGGLNPRHDMAWTQGMDAWKPAGEIEGLFERRAAIEPSEGLAPTADPYQTPQHDSVEQQMGTEGGWPGARRRSYLFTNFLLPAIVGFVAGLAKGALQELFGAETGNLIVLGATILPVFIALYFSIQRFPNLGMSRWWFLGNFVPFLNFWVAYRCFACPAGYASHKKLDGIGILLAIVYWLIVAVAVLALVAIIAVIAGAFGDPEIQRQFQEALRQATASEP